jgi:hypothetical protein
VAANRERICTFANGWSEQNAESTSDAVVEAVGLERIVFGQDPLGPHDQSLAFGCEPLKAVPAIDQRDVELSFELGDRGGQCGLGDVALLGRPGEVALLGDRNEVLQLTE